MKLAFSTLGCPAWTLDRILDAAVRWRFDGVELRGIQDELDLPNSAHFSPPARSETRRRFDDLGIAIACVSSSVRLCTQTSDDRARQVEDGKANIALAAELGCSLVRVFGGRIPQGLTREEGSKRAADVLSELGDFAAERAVTVVLETHDDFIASEDVSQVLRMADSRGAAALWDINHPVRFKGEPPEVTVANLGGFIRHVHIKDSLPDQGRHTLVGQGDLPIPNSLRLLRRMGYDGYLSLEWEKRWVPALEEPEVAFPHYAETMRRLLKEV